MKYYETLADLPAGDAKYYAHFTAQVFVVQKRDAQVILTVSDLTENPMFRCRFVDRVFFGSLEEKIGVEKLVQVIVLDDSWDELVSGFVSVTGDSLFVRPGTRTNVAKYGLFVDFHVKVKMYSNSLECVISEMDPESEMHLIGYHFKNLDFELRHRTFTNVLENTPMEFLIAERHNYERMFGVELFQRILDGLQYDGKLIPLCGSQSSDIKNGSPFPELPTDDEFEKDYRSKRVEAELTQDEDEAQSGGNSAGASFRELNLTNDDIPREVEGYIIEINNIDKFCTKTEPRSIPKLNQLDLYMVLDLSSKKPLDELDLLQITIPATELYTFFEMEEIEQIYVESSKLSNRMRNFMCERVRLNIVRTKRRMSDSNYILGWTLVNTTLNQIDIRLH
ncbi:unnamed protein product [Cyberlindnera jadinii]|uniref:Uncharacterized protein n=1 Tax=Cyberlindnera jadinii (strain ATCC 18201 / CBS 1600 / BCRC 20928 / JCM 3617 / NBRC 0987 / NRRL Y-1542) TaxID=983966 RepID=A0A0H5CBM9_CYBJN|nr:unnamed protein product [Cyberlindnera jadinii]